MAGATIRDVAREAGVSIATVSYVLNNSRRVREESRRRVLDAAQRLGYRANIIARNLQASESRLFGYSWRPAPVDQINPILDRFLQAAAESAAAHGYRILTFPTATIEDELAMYQELILIGQVDGFILSNTNLDDPRVRDLMDTGFPFVAFGRSNPQFDFLWVDIDGERGIRMATEHLLSLGHRRIGCLAWPVASYTGQNRLQGYLAGMSAAGLAIDPDWVLRIENSHSDSYGAACQMLALPADRRPTAFICMSDVMAMGATNAIWDTGLVVGRDVAVVGFDDAPPVRFWRPPLTTLSQPVAEVGERLISMLVDLCNGRPVAERHVLLQPELIVRASTVPPDDFPRLNGCR